jgi:hypothetical protein
MQQLHRNSSRENYRNSSISLKESKQFYAGEKNWLSRLIIIYFNWQWIIIVRKIIDFQHQYRAQQRQGKLLIARGGDYLSPSANLLCHVRALLIERTKSIGDNEYLFERNEPREPFGAPQSRRWGYTNSVGADKINPSYQRVPSANCLIKAISLRASHPIYERVSHGWRDVTSYCNFSPLLLHYDYKRIYTYDNYDATLVSVMRLIWAKQLPTRLFPSGPINCHVDFRICHLRAARSQKSRLQSRSLHKVCKIKIIFKKIILYIRDAIFGQ